MGSLESAELISEQADKKDDTPSTQELELSAPNSASGSGSREGVERLASRGTPGTGKAAHQPLKLIHFFPALICQTYDSNTAMCRTWQGALVEADEDTLSKGSLACGINRGLTFFLLGVRDSRDAEYREGGRAAGNPGPAAASL